MEKIDVTFTKLDGGRWQIRIPLSDSEPNPGDRVTFCYPYYLW